MRLIAFFHYEIDLQRDVLGVADCKLYIFGWLHKSCRFVDHGQVIIVDIIHWIAEVRVLAHDSTASIYVSDRISIGFHYFHNLIAVLATIQGSARVLVQIALTQSKFVREMSLITILLFLRRTSRACVVILIVDGVFWFKLFLIRVTRQIWSFDYLNLLFRKVICCRCMDFDLRVSPCFRIFAQDANESYKS